MEPTTESGFFKAAPYRIIAISIMLVLAVVALGPWGLTTLIGTTTLSSITLTVMQVLGVILLIGDRFVSRRRAEREN